LAEVADELISSRLEPLHPVAEKLPEEAEDGAQNAQYEASL